jgi:hypothetical protein
VLAGSPGRNAHPWLDCRAGIDPPSGRPAPSSGWTETLTGANRPPLPKALASKCQLDPSEVKALNSPSSSGPRFKTLWQEIVVEQGQPCPAYECHLIAVDYYRAVARCFRARHQDH